MPGKFLRVERYILVTCRACGNTYETGHPCGAAQRTPAWADAPYASGFLAGTDLLHLDTHLECFGQHLYELAEIDTLVGNIVEYGLVAVTLILHVADFHVELKARRDFTGTDHGVVFQRFGFFVAFKV